MTGNELEGIGKGLDALPIPISTPGYDCAPYLTAANCVTRDPETGTQNMGTYRAGLKSPTRLAVRMVARAGGAEGYLHWEKYKARGEPMPINDVPGPRFSCRQEMASSTVAGSELVLMRG